MEEEVRGQWGDSPALSHPAIGMHFCCANRRSDRDNMFTTVLDALVKGGALQDDCIAKSNGAYLTMPAIVAPTPVTTVWLEPSGDIAPLVEKMEEVAFLTQMPASPGIRKRRNRWKQAS